MVRSASFLIAVMFLIGAGAGAMAGPAPLWREAAAHSRSTSTARRNELQAPRSASLADDVQAPRWGEQGRERLAVPRMA
ncbi:MAG TPA: hypothetical protein VEL75_16950 [Candidatus Methylomirabilis sp.]|nr:hypothetical protein [Candidatus Methylomirabilis sp.]